VYHIIEDIDLDEYSSDENAIVSDSENIKKI